MKNPKASTPVESSRVKEAAIVKPRKYYLLVFTSKIAFRFCCSVEKSYEESILP